MTTACVLVANGFEETEAVAVIDVLRRAGIQTRVLGVEGIDPVGSHDIRLRADALFSDEVSQSWDAIILPGGMPGSTTLRDSETVQSAIRSQFERGKLVAAICAAPIALSKAGILRERRATSFPGVRQNLVCAEYLDQPVVSDRGVITSQGPGTAIAFGLEIVAELKGRAAAETVRTQMLA